MLFKECRRSFMINHLSPLALLHRWHQDLCTFSVNRNDSRILHVPKRCSPLSDGSWRGPLPSDARNRLCRLSGAFFGPKLASLAIVTSSRQRLQTAPSSVGNAALF